ncbi:MAG: thiamine phosphate synthase [Thermostichales cyanobacterium SZTDM-1c_bins_54]
MDQAIERILDANLDRAREGVRVLEEWCRFALDRADWTARCKAMRQTLAQLHHPTYLAARNTPADVGTSLSHPQELHRQDPEHLLRVNCARVQEALRVLEEYGKLRDPHLAETAKALRYQIYDLESELLGSRLRQRLRQACLYLITMPVDNWLVQVEQSLRGGVRLVQYRHKEGSDQSRLEDLQALRRLCDQFGALLIVNDRVDLALIVGADGVHVGQTDLPVQAVRQLLGSQKIIGQSTTNAQELQIALANQVDYIGVGPFFATPTKPGKPPLSAEYVAQVRATVSIPWFAIGGIELDNLAQVMAQGARRVAVVRALMTARDPQAVAEKMLSMLAHAP